MNLHPKIAAEIADALLNDLLESNYSNYMTRDAVRALRARWIEIALSKFTSYSIEFPEEGAYVLCSSAPEVIEAFLSKYPRLRPVLDDVREKAAELEPGVQFQLEVMNDPEGCHTCREGQQLNGYVLFAMPGLNLDDPEWKAKREALRAWWIDYPGRFGPDREDVLGLFHLEGRWLPEADFTPDEAYTVEVLGFIRGAGDLPPGEEEAL